MRVGVLSDIHANLEALDAVLAHLDRLRPDLLVCLGDFVGYGPNPNECVDLLSPLLQGRHVAGNHDWAAVGRLDIAFFNPYAAEAIRWTQRVLRPPVRHYLQALPTQWSQNGALPFLAVHAIPRDPIEEYVLDGATARESFRQRQFSLCFIGHTHVPAVFLAVGDEVETRPFRAGEEIRLEAGVRYLINVGSVGQPRDGDPRASYALLDTAAAAVRLVRLEYPLQRTQEKMLGEGLPPILAERLSVGR
ncbi:MAG: metallophosphatase family protein [Firmicutes bacterium]|nr:metallophosphatase family protein [Bacillota bacterium]